jgi:hypothetical protein
VDEESERLRIEARKKLDERIRQEEKLREQDIKRQEEVNKEVQALRIKKNATPADDATIEDFKNAPTNDYSFAHIEKSPEEEEESVQKTIPAEIYS